MELIYSGNSLKSGIYQIRNKINGKIYIGSAKRFKSRVAQHLQSLQKGTHHNKHLQASYNKHGTNNFIFEIIQVVDGTLETIRCIEQKYLDEQIKLDNWNNCFNNKKKTILRSTWSHNPEKTRRKQSEHLKNRICTESTRQKLRESKLGKNNPMYKKDPWNKGRKFPEFSGENHPHFGKPMPDHVKEKLRTYRVGVPAWNKGLKNCFSEETLQKISLSGKGRIPWIKGKTHSKESKNKMSESHKGQKSWNKGQKNIYSTETLEKMRLAKLGKKGNNTKTFENIKLVSPTGEIYTKIINLTKFAKEHGLQKGNFSSLLNGKRKMYNNWTLSV